MKESFADITYRGNNIRVGNLGTIFVDGELRKNILNKDGYYQISIKDKINIFWTTARVSRLVAEAHCKKPDSSEKLEVNHINCIRSDNTYTNLEWVTHNENIKYSKDLGHYLGKFGKDNPNYGNTKLFIIYSNDKEYSRQKQGRPALQNGRCRKIDLFKDGEFVKTFDYIVLCIEYLQKSGVTESSTEGIRSRINSCCKSNKPYLKHYTFRKH